MKFYYVYVLRSLTKTNFIYVGYSVNIPKRLKQHNEGRSKSTKPYAPYDLIHYEAYCHNKDAKRREGYFKTSKGRAVLKNMLKEFFKSHTM